jgi:hypothetical protein
VFSHHPEIHKPNIENSRGGTGGVFLTEAVQHGMYGSGGEESAVVQEGFSALYSPSWWHAVEN